MGSVVSRRLLVPLVAAAVALVPYVPAAQASEMVGSNVHSIHLIVGDRGVAQVVYTTAGGQVVHLLAWGAVNARTPNTEVPQVRFALNFAGGYHSVWGAGYWRKMHNRCRPYDGPALINTVAVCTATDGSIWALQTWVRLAPNGGWATPRPATELHLSHWTGALPQLTLYENWERSNHSIDRVFGQFTYDGSGVYGYTSTATGNPTDSYGRNIYVDVVRPEWYRTAWSLGYPWYRFNSGLAHHSGVGQLIANTGKPAIGGDFCLGMWPLYGRSLPADGSAYRATAMGPGVTPIVRAEVEATAYSATMQAHEIAFERTFTPSADSCYSGGS